VRVTASFRHLYKYVDFGIISDNDKTNDERIVLQTCNYILVEILKRSPAVWPSSGRYLMYATFDDRRVGEYKYPVYMKGGRQRDRDAGKHPRQQKQQRKKRRRRRDSKLDATANTRERDTSEYYLYPEIRTIRYPKVNTIYKIYKLRENVTEQMLSV